MPGAVHRGLVLAHQRGDGGEGEGHDLGDDHAVALVAERFGQRFRADEAHIGKLAAVALGNGLLIECRHFGVGADFHDEVGLGRQDGGQRPGHIHRIAFDRAGGHGLEIVRGQGFLHARQSGHAVGVVLVEHGDLFQAEEEELIDDLAGFVVVAGADVENVGIDGRAQPHRAGERADEGNAGLIDQGFGRQGGGRADIAQQGEHITAVDEGLGIGHGAGRLVAVIEADQLEAAPGHAAVGIDLLEIRLDAHAQPDAELRRRPGERGRLADDDLRVSHARRGRKCGRGRHQTQASKQGGKKFHRGLGKNASARIPQFSQPACAASVRDIRGGDDRVAEQASFRA